MKKIILQVLRIYGPLILFYAATIVAAQAQCTGVFPSGPTTPCVNSTSSYFASGGNSGSCRVSWVSGGYKSFTNTSVTWNTTPGNYTVQFTCSCGSINYPVTVQATPVAGTISSGNQSICYGATPAGITSSGAVGQLTWQSAPVGSSTWTDLTTGSATLASGSISNTVSKQYRLVSYNCGTTLYSNTVTVTVNQAVTPPAPNNSNYSCGNQTLSFNGSPPGGTSWFWQGTNSAGTSQSSGSSTYSASTSGTYYLRAYTAGCWSAASSVVVTVNALPQDPSPAFQPSQACGLTTVTASGTVPGGQAWYWQTSPSGTTVGSPSQTATSAPYSATSNMTLYVRALNTGNGCWSTNSASTPVSVLAVPATPAAPLTTNNACGNQTVSFNGTPPAGTTWYWQTASNGTSQASSASTQTATSAGTWYVRPYIASSGCWGTASSVPVPTVNALPQDPLGATFSINKQCGSSIVSVAGTPPAQTTWFWQSSASGTSTGTPATVNPYTATAAGILYVRALAANGCWSAGTASTNVDMLAVPSSPPTPAPQTVCGQVTLTRQAMLPAGETWFWVGNDPASLATSLGSAATFTAELRGAASKSYYLKARNDGSNCWSGAAEYRLNPLLPQVSFSPASPTVCYNQATTITATGTNLLTVSWWDTATGAMLDQGNQFVTPSLTQARTYSYQAFTTEGCSTTGTLTVSVVPEMTATPAMPGLLRTTGQYSLDINNTNSVSTNYYWVSGPNGTETTAYANPRPVSSGGLYYVRAQTGGCWGPAISVRVPDLSIPQLSASLTAANQNYVKTYTYLDKNLAGDPDLLSSNQVILKTSYQDGLGREYETVLKQMSPSGKDLVQPTAYDASGRQTKSYLPYAAPTTTGEAQLQPFTSQASFYQNTPLVAANTQPFAYQLPEDATTGRPLKQFGTGIEWTDNDRGVTYQYAVNVDGTGTGQEKVIAWELDAATGLPVRSTAANTAVSGGYYTTGQLIVNSTFDEEGHEVRVYYDKEEKIVLKKVQAVPTPALGATPLDFTNPSNYTNTYYIYDVYGNLRYVLQPELVKTLVTDSNHPNPSQTDLDTYAYQYQYDYRKRQTQKKEPGAEKVYKVYDLRDRLVMVQDGNQRANKQWVLTKYDAINRPIMTALYTHPTVVDQTAMSSLISSTDFYESYNGSATTNGYTNAVWPLSGFTALITTYYDDYRFINDLTLGGTYNYSPTDMAGQDGANYSVRGYFTGSKVNVLGTTNYLHEATYYDSRYRTIQTISQNIKGGWDRSTSLLDFAGRLLNSKTIHHTATHADQTVARRLVYDPMSRLKQIFHQVNANGEKLLVQNDYNEIGQLIDKKLYSANGISFQQSVDYRYNIRGWLTSMNNSQLTIDGTNDDSNDLFGMNLGYNAGMGTGSTAFFNGNISAVKWSSNLALGTVKDVAYNYSYDVLNRLTAANYLINNAGTWSNSNGANSESGYTYDLNGNVRTLLRKGNTGSEMDNLIYTYIGNQLLGVSDQADKALGFIDGTNTGDDYTYDANGNMNRDLNKRLGVNVSDNSHTIQYNFLNLPQQMMKNSGESLVFDYEASGIKLAERVFNTSGALTKTSEYIGEFVYQNDTLLYIQHEEGRIVMKSLAQPEYQYYLKDHLGNVRITFTTQSISKAYTAGFETANQPAEVGNFFNYQSNKINTLIPANPNATTGNSAYYLNGGYTGQVGIAKSFSVMPGDQVSIQANVTYHTPTNTAANFGSFVSSLLAAFNLPAPAVGETGTPASGISAFGNWELGVNGDENKTDVIKAFATIILFDKNYNLLDVTYQAVQPNGTVNASYKARQPGYAYVYVSNEHPYLMDVYFDDVIVTYTPSPIIQQADYYPFGLVLSQSTRENTVPQNYQYNGKEVIRDLGLNWSDYGARMYMPEIGRWGTIDPLSENNRRLSAYNYAINNPIRFIDPDGMEWWGAGADMMAQAVDESGINDGLFDRGQQIDPKPKTKPTSPSTRDVPKFNRPPRTLLGPKPVSGPFSFLRYVARGGVMILAAIMKGDASKREIKDPTYTIKVAIERENLAEGETGHAVIGFSSSDGVETWYHQEITNSETGATTFKEMSQRQMTQMVENGKFYSKIVTGGEYYRALNAVGNKLNTSLGCYDIRINSCVTNVRDVLSYAHQIPISIRPLPSELEKFIQTIGYISKF
jgi:RHS repeat-associated protein